MVIKSHEKPKRLGKKNGVVCTYTPAGKLPRYVVVPYRSSVGVVYGIIEVIGVSKHNKPIAYNILPYLSHREAAARNHMLHLEERFWQRPTEKIFWVRETPKKAKKHGKKIYEEVPERDF